MMATAEPIASIEEPAVPSDSAVTGVAGGAEAKPCDSVAAADGTMTEANQPAGDRQLHPDKVDRGNRVPVVVEPPAAIGAAAIGTTTGPEVVAGPIKVLVLGDENLVFTSGMQEAYPDVEFTVASVLSRQNIEAYNFDPLPQLLRGRIRHMVDPCRVGKNFRQQEFDGIVLFLPGLSFMVPKELGTADRPLFAYRTHLFAFHVIRHAKLVLKVEGKLHLVWPDETGLMTSPCGAAGIEMTQLLEFCGCRPIEPMFSIEKLPEGYFMPFLFGEIPEETPEWLSGLSICSFSIDKNPVSIPLSVALLLHPDVGFVSIKDQSPDAPTAGTPFRACLVHEANARKDRLKELFGPKESADDAVDAYGLVPEPLDEDSLLSVPMEIFMISFDDVPHLSLLLRFQVCDDQPQVSVAGLDVLDPRLPTRIARPPPPKTPNPLLAVMNSLTPGHKRGRQAQEEWGGMKFYCPLTKICTMTPERMRMHVQGDLYKKMAAKTPGWEDSAEKKEMMEIVQEAEAAEESHNKARKGNSGKGKSKGKPGT